MDIKKRFTEEQIIGFLREADAGILIMKFCGRTMLTCTHAHKVALQLIEPGKTNQKPIGILLKIG